MSEARGLTVDNRLQSIAPALFMLWVKFNFDNEPANCIHLVQIGRIDTNITSWPGMKAHLIEGTGMSAIPNTLIK